MAILIDQIRTHSSSGTGDDTPPLGITGLDWCHLVSTVSEAELLGFLTANFLTIGQDPSNMRTPDRGSLQTYAGLDAAMHAAAITAGAKANREQTVRVSGFDSPGGSGPYYER